MEPDFSQMGYSDIVRIRPFDLGDAQLETLIEGLNKHRDFQLENVTPSVSALNGRIELSHRLLTSRANERLAKQSLEVATKSLRIATISAVVSGIAVVTGVLSAVL